MKLAPWQRRYMRSIEDLQYHRYIAANGLDDANI